MSEPPQDPAAEDPAGQEQVTAQELVDRLLSNGYTRTQIAQAIGRTPSLVSKIHTGVKPARNLVGALQELLDTGHTTAPDRRRRKDGRLAKVRGRRGQRSVVPRTIQQFDRPLPEEPAIPVEEPTITGEAPEGDERPEKLHPAQPQHTLVTPPQRSRVFFDEKHLANGQYSASVRWPRRNIDARDQAVDMVRDIVGEAEQRHDRWQAVVWFEVKDDDDFTHKFHAKLGSKGGYSSGNVLGALGEYEERGEDILDWLKVQCSQRGVEVSNTDTGSIGSRDVQRGTIIGIDMDAW